MWTVHETEFQVKGMVVTKAQRQEITACSTQREQSRLLSWRALAQGSVVYDKTGELGQGWGMGCGALGVWRESDEYQSQKYDQALTKLEQTLYFQFLILYAHTYQM